MVSGVLGLSSFSPAKIDLLWRRVRNLCPGKCCDRKLAELQTTRAGINICHCDEAPLKYDRAPWVCPPCSKKNDFDDERHNEFQEDCIDKLVGSGKGWTSRRASVLQEFLGQSERVKKGFCECGVWGKDAKDEGLMVCSWCQGEVKLGWEVDA